MGRAQVMQAEAAGIEPSVLMNPILLKPTSDVGSQVIVNGEVRQNMRAAEYFKYKNEIVKVPIHEGRFTDMRCPDSHFFEVTSTDEGRKIGAETISINGNGY